MGGLFGGGKAAPFTPVQTVLSTPAPAPVVAAPAPMPTIDDAAVKAAKKKSLTAAQQRGGRAATVLTDGEDKLG